MENPKKIYTVSELNKEIRIILENAYPDIWLEGEISNFKTYSSGHMYLSLKDNEAQINAVIFKNVNQSFKFKLEDGLKVITRGRVSSYPKRGDYQVIITYIEPAGKGALQLAFEQLKAKLEKEGLFDQARKKPIPLLPQKIGIITSPTGAAIKDILSVIDRRFANVEIILYPVRVQGDEAKFDIVEALKYLNSNYDDLDVLLVGRGGGSYEDLWAFNEEMVARAIAESKIPVISCVGHEIDFTISDFVADLRAPTPSAAAELVVKNKAELVDKLNNLKSHLTNNIQFTLSHYNEKINYLGNSRALRRPWEIFEERTQDLDVILNDLTAYQRNILNNKEHVFSKLSDKLNLLSPLNTLTRGYAICFSQPGNTIVKKINDVKVHDTLKVKLHDGEFISKVTNTSAK
ncbi:MAG: exodeoxyribonuclease VII large subunit [Elusimicrobia bacterium]|nr:exodeoxyribonuclease VII large subunit [Candidatus Liberimonas magnetica]